MGTGKAQGDVVSIDPMVAYEGKGHLHAHGSRRQFLGGEERRHIGVIDGASTVTLGTADVAADGSYKLHRPRGPASPELHHRDRDRRQRRDDGGAIPLVCSGRLPGCRLRGAEGCLQRDGNVDESTTNYDKDGSDTVSVHTGGQTLYSGFFDTFLNGGAPDGTFVFDPGHGLDVVQGFRFNGTDHDTISLPSADLADLAAVLSHTRNTAGGAVITDPTSGDTIKLVGVTKAELKAHPSGLRLPLIEAP